MLRGFQTNASVPSAANSRLSPLPHEPADFYDRSAPVDIPLDSAAVCEKLMIMYMQKKKKFTCASQPSLLTPL